MKKQLIINGIIILLVCIGLSGCESKKSIYDEGYDDKTFHSLIKTQSKEISERLESTETLINNEDWNLLDLEYNSLLNYTSDSKNQVNLFHLSVAWEDIKNGYVAYLDDLTSASYNGIMGVTIIKTYGDIKEISKEYYEEYIKYFNEAQNYFDERDRQLYNATYKFNSCMTKINNLYS